MLPKEVNIALKGIGDSTNRSVCDRQQAVVEHSVRIQHMISQDSSHFCHFTACALKLDAENCLN